MSEQQRLLDTEEPYFIDYREHCRIWEIRARLHPYPDTGWGLKQFDSSQKARTALLWLLADWRQTGQVRRHYPKEAPFFRESPSR